MGVMQTGWHASPEEHPRGCDGSQGYLLYASLISFKLLAVNAPTCGSNEPKAAIEGTKHIY